MRLVADYHTHTVYSHGKGSVDDNVREALRRELKAVAISDHSMAHALYGVQRVDEYLADISRAKEKFAGRIEVRAGIELNITGLDGSVDLPQGVFDTVIMGYHKSAWCRDLRTMWVFSTPGFASRADEITRAYIQAMRRHRIDIIAHPGYGVPVDVKTLAKACADYGVLWEINNKHADMGPEDLALAASVGARFVISSDAHSPEHVGRAPAAFSLAREAGLGAAQIANVTEE